MKRTQVKELVEALQRRFVSKLESVSLAVGQQEKFKPFKPIEWLRDEGQHGGGVRYVVADSEVFNRASVNVSQVHYDDSQDKSLSSATALSTIIHPQNPYAPSMHMHISWTELKNGKGYWRIMADLNPAIVDSKATELFSECLRKAASQQYTEAAAQGDRYFYIPALKRHRGVSHFYLENYNSGDEQADSKLAQTVGESVIDAYSNLLQQAIIDHPTPTEENYTQQLAYHTLYFLQVLTLDRGTTSGLLIHNQNDVGILGSLPAKINKLLLATWRDKVIPPQTELLDGLLKVLSSCNCDDNQCPIDNEIKQKLANEVRQFYQVNPEALNQQASGEVIPATVENHR